MLRRFLIRLIMNAIALWVAASLVEGITFTGTPLEMLLLALIFGLVNSIIKPVVKFFTLPLIFLTLGLLLLVINTAMLLLTDYLSASLTVDGLMPAFLGSVVISVVSFILSLLLFEKRRR